MAESLIYISFHKLKGNLKTYLSRHLDIQLCNLACYKKQLTSSSNDTCIDKHIASWSYL